MGVAVALDQPAAVQDFHAERIVFARTGESQFVPAPQMLDLDLVAQQAAAPAAQAAYEPEHGKTGKAIGADVAAAIDAAGEKGRELRQRRNAGGQLAPPFQQSLRPADPRR